MTHIGTGFRDCAGGTAGIQISSSSLIHPGSGDEESQSILYILISLPDTSFLAQKLHNIPLGGLHE